MLPFWSTYEADLLEKMLKYCKKHPKPEKNSFSSFFFLSDIDGHLDDKKIKNSLEELAFHCEDMHVLGVYKAHEFREKK